MATQKQPRFPHPPLEIGVAQYPTPLVPNYTDKKGGWGFTDQGHIILVEKVSIEKGTFNPQPLDGSVTYTGRDANKWPSSLYLVAEKPTEDGEFCYRYWANSRTYSSQNPWNYNISYSFDDPGYPIYSRTYIIKRTDYSAVAILAKDPIFNSIVDGGSYAYMVQQEMQELPEDNPLRSLFVAHKVVYETLPGSPKGSNENKPGLMGTQVVKDQYVLPSTVPDSLTFNSGGTSVLQSEVEALSSTKSELKTVSTTGPYELAGKALGEFGLITTDESIVGYGSNLPTPSTTTVKLEESPIDSTKSKLTNYNYSSLQTLTGYQYDADLNLVITNTKQIVNPSTSLSFTNGLISSRDEPIDPYKTVRIQSNITGLPDNRTEYKTGSYASPNLITDYQVSFLNTSNAETVTKVQPIMRAKRSYETVFKYVTSYQYGSSTPSYTLFDPLAVNIYVDTFLFQLNIPDSLTDAYGPYNLTTLPNNPTYGYITDSFQITATSPTATEYLALISAGAPQLISYELTYWKANIYRLSEVYVFLK